MRQKGLQLSRHACLRIGVLGVAIATSQSLFDRAAAAEPRLFQFESEAHQHCPSDTVVWVNPKTGIYVFSSEQRWYGKTKPGAYVCQLEGKAAGYHAAKKR